MKVWVLSDTHMKHWEIYPIPKADMVIHAGDATNHKSPDINRNEMLDFLDWYSGLDIKYKIFVAGNHDCSLGFNRMGRSEIENRGIIYLEHQSVEIEGVNIFGSPFTPKFGVGWAFNKDRGKLDEYWKMIPENTDILITHGPPLGILDTTYSGGKDEDGERIKGGLTACGCKALARHVIRVAPKFHVFGHLHDEDTVSNAGMFKKNGCPTWYINASVVTLRHELKNEGEVIEI